MSLWLLLLLVPVYFLIGIKVTMFVAPLSWRIVIDGYQPGYPKRLDGEQLDPVTERRKMARYVLRLALIWPYFFLRR